MSLLPSQTNINLNEYFFLRGSGQQLNVSTLNANNISTSSLFGSSIVANDVVSGHLSTLELDAGTINTSTISSIAIDIDGQYLTATPTELLLNGVPLATTSNLSSIADWSLDPAISTVQMNGNNINAAGQISTGSIVGGSAFFGQLMAINSMFLSTYTSTISSVVFDAEQANISSLSTAVATGGDFSPSTVWGQPSSFYQPYVLPPDPAFSTITASNATLSSINGQSITTGSAGSAANWAQYPANANVILNNQSTLVTNGVMALNASGSLVGGTIDLTADAGLGDAGFGTVRINANGGSVDDVGFGGLIEMNARTPIGLSNLTSAIKMNAAGINSYAGAIPSFGSVAGYNFIFGQLGVNLCSGLPSLGFQIPGTTYLYGIGGPTNGGIRMESPAGVELINNTDFYFYRQYPFYNPFTVGAPSNALISGRVAGGLYNQYVNLEKIGHIYFGFDANRTGQIDYLSTINGATIDYFENFRWSDWPALGPVNASTINTQQLQQVSSINGQPISFYEPGGVSTVSTFVNASISSATISSINGGIPYTTANPPPTTTIPSTFADLHTSSLQASTINFNNGTQLQRGVPFQGTGGVSTLEVFWSEAVPPLSADLRVGGLVISGDDVGGTNVSKDVLLKNLDNGQRIGVYGPVGTSVSTLAFLSDIPVATSNFSTITVSTIKDQSSTINIYNADLASLTFNPAGDITGIASNYITLQAQGPGVLVGATYNGGPAGNSSNYATNRYDIAASTIFMSTNLASVRNFSTSVIGTSSLTFNGLSSINFVTAATAGTASQPIGRLLMSGCDLDLQQNDLWAQQVRVGAGNPGGSAQTEVILYSPDNLTIRGIGIGGQDRALRTVSTINSGTGGYILDTTINPPFFSTLGGTSTALMAYFPSTSLSTIGVSSISIMPPLTYIASVYDSTTQTVAGANTATNTTWNTTSLNLGGFTIGTSTIGVPVAGIYELGVSFQFATPTGGTRQAQFWPTKNGTALPQTNSIVSIVNNGDTLGNITLLDQAAAGDQYGLQFYSADASMAATATAAGATPAIPSIIFNAKRVG